MRLISEAEVAAVEPVRESDSLDEENTLKKNFVRRVSEGLEAGETDLVYELVEPLHPADIADIVEDLPAAEREAVFETIDEEVAAEALEELEKHGGHVDLVVSDVVMPEMDSRSTANWPLRSVSWYRKITLRMIQPIGNRP